MSSTDLDTLRLPDILATGNPNKAAEFRQIIEGIILRDRANLGLDHTRKRVHALSITAQEIPNLPEIQSTYVHEVIIPKAIAAYERAGKPVLVEDTGLYIHGFGNQFPGALYKFIEKDERGRPGPGRRGLLAMINTLKNRSARATTIIGYYDGERVRMFEGDIQGQIALKERGENGFGFDSILEVDGKTLAEMTGEEKNRLSMRRMAIENMVNGIEMK